MYSADLAVSRRGVACSVPGSVAAETRTGVNGMAGEQASAGYRQAAQKKTRRVAHCRREAKSCEEPWQCGAPGATDGFFSKARQSASWPLGQQSHSHQSHSGSRFTTAALRINQSSCGTGAISDPRRDRDRPHVRAAAAESVRPRPPTSAQTTARTIIKPTRA